MDLKKNMEGCQMSFEKNVSFEDVKSGLHAKAFMTRPIVH